jgi:epoxyqueuosine reductase QueG
MQSFQKNPEEILIRKIQNFALNNPGNRMTTLDNRPFFEEPLVGFADGKDSIFKQFKDDSIIGDFHLTPIEMMEQSFPEHKEPWDGVSVISWVLPIYKKTRISNRKQERYPSKPWTHTRTYGQPFNEELTAHIVDVIQKQGYIAVAPVFSPAFREFHIDTDLYITSNWSERHIAYAAGLGTFGLNGSLITQKGVTMRCGSVVTNLKLKPTARPYSNPREYCLFINSGTCGTCMERCPSGAITDTGPNNETCMTHFAEVVMNTLDHDASLPGCGLCQTAVPCEARIPKTKKRSIKID